MAKYGLWFCGTEQDAPDWLRHENGEIRTFFTIAAAKRMRNHLYSGEEGIEIRELTENGGTQEGDTRTAE